MIRHRGKDANSGDRKATLMRSDCTTSKISSTASLSGRSTANVSHQPSQFSNVRPKSTRRNSLARKLFIADLRLEPGQQCHKKRNSSGGLEAKLEKLSKRRNQTRNAGYEMCIPTGIAFVLVGREARGIMIPVEECIRNRVIINIDTYILD